MLKNKIFLILFAAVIATAAFAQVEPPQDPFLPYYYVRGTVSLPGGGAAAGRTVVFYLNNANLALGRYVRAVTNASGYYELNAFELSYYFGDAVSVDGTTQYRVAVLNNPADNLGAGPQTITLQTGQGFTEQNFALTAGDGIISTFRLGSDFDDGTAINIAHAAAEVGGQNQSIPLTWNGYPLNTGSFALSMIDTSVANTVHWLAVNLPPAPASPTALANNASTLGMPEGSVQLDNYLGAMRYDGPNPPAGDASVHNYIVTVYALQNSIASRPSNLNDFMTAVNGATLLGQASITGTFSRASAGPVALNIAREGSAIRISWNNNTSPNPQIFFRTGDGSGQFANAYDTNWLPVNSTTADFDFGAGNANYNSGFILHTGQVGAGAGEAYYKAISAGVVVTSPGGLAAFADAGAVGKVNTRVRSRYNAISYPFNNTLPVDAQTLMGNQLGEGDQIHWWNQAAQRYQIITRPAAGWPAGGHNFELAEGFFVYLLPGSVARDEQLTFVGTVGNFTPAAQKNLGLNYTLIGYPHPVSRSANAIGLTPREGDQIHAWIYDTQRFGISTYVSSAWNNLSLINFTAGEAKFYYTNTAYSWELNF